MLCIFFLFVLLFIAPSDCIPPNGRSCDHDHQTELVRADDQLSSSQLNIEKVVTQNAKLTEPLSSIKTLNSPFRRSFPRVNWEELISNICAYDAILDYAYSNDDFAKKEIMSKILTTDFTLKHLEACLELLETMNNMHETAPKVPDSESRNPSSPAGAPELNTLGPKSKPAKKSTKDFIHWLFHETSHPKKYVGGIDGRLEEKRRGTGTEGITGYSISSASQRKLSDNGFYDPNDWPATAGSHPLLEPARYDLPDDSPTEPFRKEVAALQGKETEDSQDTLTPLDTLFMRKVKNIAASIEGKSLSQDEKESRWYNFLKKWKE